MADICPITLADSIVKEFVATVEIPIGFAIDEEHAYPYTLFLSVDKSAVNFTVREEVFDSLITVPSFDKEPGEGVPQTQELSCKSRVRVLKFEGPLFYNSVISGFVPVSALNAIKTGEEPLELMAPTAFSTADTLLIGDTVGYACFECELPDNIVDGFDVKISQLPEFIINNKGNIITHNPESADTFFAELVGSETQIIHVPYTLTLTPKTIEP